MKRFTSMTEEKARKLIEKRMIKAVVQNKNVDLLISEVEAMYANDMINDSDFNFLTDIETIKAIYS